MKILHIANTDHYSGGENVICQIISLFVEDKNVEMAYVSPDGQIRDALKERNIRFIPVKEMSRKELKAVFEKEKPDVVHAHDMKASLIAALACKNSRLVVHLHNNEYANRTISKKSLSFLIPAKKAKHIFYVSKSAHDGYYFHKWFERKSSVLYNVIDISALEKKMSLDSKTYDYDVVYLGRLTYPKNPIRLLKVLRKVADVYPDFKTALVGTGEMEDEVRKAWEEMGLQKNVDLLGFQSNPLKIVKDAKLMLMTSRWEGTPMCALESFAMGTPIVSTPTDGLVDLIDEGETGFLSDNDDVLVEKIVSLIKNRELRAKMSEYCLRKSAKINDLKEYKQAISKAYFG